MPELEVPASSDSHLRGAPSELQDANYGGSPIVWHRVKYSGGEKTNWMRGIGNFDVSALAGAVIVDAKLVRELVGVTNGGVSARLARCTRPSAWTEHGVTWNDYDGANPWTSVGGDFDDEGPPAALTYTEPTATGTHEIAGLRPFVADALAQRNGIVSLITRLVDEAPGVSTEFGWDAKESGATGWRLVIEYEPPSPGRRGLSPAARARSAPARPAATARPARAGRPRRPAGRRNR